MIETLLEGVKIYSGLPWWGSIAITATIVRICLFPLFVRAADTAGRLATLQPYIKPIQERIRAASSTQDRVSVAAASQEMKELYSSAKVEVWRPFVPMIVQIPLGYGSFRLMKGMAALPVPGLDSQGILWLQDLTVSDPYLILPLTTAGIYYYIYKVN